MSDWQKGDLALCVKIGTWSIDGKGPRAGSVSTVRATHIGEEGDLYLGLQEWPDDPLFNQWFWSARFRRIPPHTPDAEDAETIKLLNGAPVGEPA